MTNQLCMNCFNVIGKETRCPYCGYEEGTPPQEVFHLWPGTILSERYIVGVCIGFGGFGITYKAYDMILGVIVAIKEFYPAGLVNRAPGEQQIGVLSGDKQDEYEIQLKRFLLEAQSIAQFGKAKDIVNVYDFFEQNGTAYIIMEYIDGILLKDYMEQEGRLDVDTAVYLITPIIEALKKVHGSGIIHRDISPDNIFITSEGAIKLFDFGAAVFANEQAENLSDAVIKAGYAPPEQYRSKSKQGAFSDVYSVGAILYQMITGERPAEASDRVIKDEVARPSDFGIRLDPNLDRAIMQAMAVRPEFRFQYIEQLQEAIEDKRVAEYPEEKIQLMRKKRRLFASVTLSVLLACVVVALVLINRVRQGNEVLTSALEACELSIWVPYAGNQSGEDAKKQMEFLIKDFRENSANFQGNDKVTIHCEAVEAERYAGLYQEACAQGVEPDIFCTDYVAEDTGTGLEKLYDCLDEKEYFGLSQYQSFHRDQKSVPLGMRTMCIYFFNGQTDRVRVDVKEILTEGGLQNIYLDKQKVGNLLVQYDSSLLKSFPIAVTEQSGEYVKELAAAATIMSLAGKSGIFSKVSAEYQEGVKDVAVMTDTEFNKQLYQYNSENYDRKIEYGRALLTVDGTALFSYCDTYAVSKKTDVDENKKRAAQRFLYLCMSRAENAVYYSGTSRVIPINRGAWLRSEEAAYTDELLETIATENLDAAFVNESDLAIYTEEVQKEWKGLLERQEE